MMMTVIKRKLWLVFVFELRKFNLGSNNHLTVSYRGAFELLLLKIIHVVANFLILSRSLLCKYFLIWLKSTLVAVAWFVLEQKKKSR